MTYERFEEDAQRAEENYHSEVIRGRTAYALVDASAKTGTRYTVVVTVLPAPIQLGGRYLVSVIYPTGRNVTYPCGCGDLDMSYVAEKFRGDGRDWHGGDLKALTMAINQAIELAAGVR